MMKIGGEEVELVRSFDEMKPGVVIWLYPCRCGAKHRLLLLNPAEPLRGHPGYIATPDPSCKPAWYEGPTAVYWNGENPTVFRVVEGLPNQAEDEARTRADVSGARFIAAVRQRHAIERGRGRR